MIGYNKSDITSLDTAYYHWHLWQLWEDIYTSWRKDIVAHSWDL